MKRINADSLEKVVSRESKAIAALVRLVQKLRAEVRELRGCIHIIKDDTWRIRENTR